MTPDLPPSDIDVLFLCDTTKEDLDVTTDKLFDERDALMKPSFTRRLRGIKTKKMISGLSTDISETAIERVIENFTSRKYGLLTIEPLALMFGFATGHAINEYRQKAIEKINKLEPSKAKKIIEEIIRHWTNHEVIHGDKKLLTRYRASSFKEGEMPSREAGKERLEIGLEERRELWRRRIERFFNPPPAETPPARSEP